MKERIYFDHSATSFPKPKAVADEMYRYLTEVGVNVNRGGYGSAYGAEEVLFDTREQIRNLFHGSNGRNVVFVISWLLISTFYVFILTKYTTRIPFPLSMFNVKVLPSSSQLFLPKTGMGELEVENG